MARYSSGDGTVRCDYVPSVANKAAPTTAELNAGTQLSPFLSKDGLKRPTDQNMVDMATLADTFDSQVPGSFGGPIELTLDRNSAGGGTDTAWNLIVYGLAGFIVIREGVATATAAWASTNPVQVFPVTFHEPVPLDTASNERAKFTARGAVTSQPNMKAVVA